MTERPILFSAPMVRAILAGTKTQTRRVVKWRGLEPGLNLGFSGLSVERSGSNWVLSSPTRTSHEYRSVPQPCPYGAPGDRLWVRESHWFFQDEHDPVTGYTPPVLTAEDVEYRADGESARHGWRPSIHMPRWASRITLEIAGVRVERLQAITEDDARAEGITDGGCLNCGNPELSCGCLNPRPDARDSFVHLWMSINGEASWHGDPWVWAIDFRRLP